MINIISLQKINEKQKNKLNFLAEKFSIFSRKHFFAK